MLQFALRHSFSRTSSHLVLSAKGPDDRRDEVAEGPDNRREEGLPQKDSNHLGLEPRYGLKYNLNSNDSLRE